MRKMVPVKKPMMMPKSKDNGKKYKIPSIFKINADVNNCPRLCMMAVKMDNAVIDKYFSL